MLLHVVVDILFLLLDSILLINISQCIFLFYSRWELGSSLFGESSVQYMSFDECKYAIPGNGIQVNNILNIFDKVTRKI